MKNKSRNKVPNDKPIAGTWMDLAKKAIDLFITIWKAIEFISCSKTLNFQQFPIQLDSGI